MEYIYVVASSDLLDLERAIDSAVRNSFNDTSRIDVANSWQEFWMLVDRWEPSIAWDLGKRSGRLKKSDYDNVKRDLGASLSCSELSYKLNKRYGKEFCVRFERNVSSQSFPDIYSQWHSRVFLTKEELNEKFK